ncbi:MAG: hypothetical protein ABFS32_00955 [Bacteroidota bacterium]
MKLRIKGNTIRIRLTNKEVQMLVNGEKIENATVFPSAILTYLMQPSDKGGADFIDNSIQINLTKEEIGILSAEDDKGISKEIPTEKGNKLSILVEQDLLA